MRRLDLSKHVNCMLHFIEGKSCSCLLEHSVTGLLLEIMNTSFVKYETVFIASNRNVRVVVNN
jgi:hypothetical protein